MAEETKEEAEARCKSVMESIMLASKEENSRMSCGEMLTRLAGIGWDAALLYDDNGHWGMPTAGHASISPEISDWEGGYFVEAKMWKDTPREAIIFAVELRLEDL